MSSFGGFVLSTIGFAVVAVASSQVSIVVTYIPYFPLPLITGYMFFGLIAGPQICELVTPTDLSNVSFITQFALSFISLSAGAELYLPELRALFTRILSLTGALTAVTFIGCTLTIYAMAASGFIGQWITSLPGACQLSVSMIAAAIMVSQSPASAIAVVRETQAKGIFTSTFLGVTVLIDVVVLLLASVAESIANSQCDPNANGFNVVDFALTLGTIALAFFVGWIVGKIIIFLLWLPTPLEYLILPLGYGVFQFSSWFLSFSTDQWGHGVNLDPLLVCITGGYVVANQSRNRRKFLRFFAKCGPVIFIPFFTLTGAGLKLGVLGASLPFAILTALIRAACFFAASFGIGHYVGMPFKHRQWMWIGMITQAGVSLGIAAEVALSFPAFGTDFQSTIISVILINQIFGPILCTTAIRKVNEDGLAVIDDDESDKIKRAVLIGCNEYTLAVAQRLLYANWDILFLDDSEDALEQANTLFIPLREDHEHPLPPTAEPTAGASASAVASESKADDGTESAAAADADGAPASLASTTDYHSVPSTRTPDRVITRLVTPASSDSDADDAAHRAWVVGYESQLADVTTANCTAVAVCIGDDSRAFAVCNLLLEHFALTKVVCLVENPNWASMMASIGVLPIYSFSSAAQLMTAALTTPFNSAVEIIRSKRPFHTALAAIIKPDSTATVPFHMLNASDVEKDDYLRLHPNPPLPQEKLWKFNEKLRVVTAAVREEYVSAIFGVHASKALFNVANAAKLSEETFLGPNMTNEHGAQRMTRSSRDVSGMQSVLSDDRDDDDDGEDGDDVEIEPPQPHRFERAQSLTSSGGRIGTHISGGSGLVTSSNAPRRNDLTRSGGSSGGGGGGGFSLTSTGGVDRAAAMLTSTGGRRQSKRNLSSSNPYADDD